MLKISPLNLARKSLSDSFAGRMVILPFRGERGVRTPVAPLSKTGKAFGFAVFSESTAPAHS
jgi:hypothetical protein